MWDDFYLNVFVVFYWNVEVKAPHISTYILCMWNNYNNVSKNFGSDKVCCSCYIFMWIFDEAPSNCNCSMVRIRFLLSVVHYDLGKCNLSICRYVLIAS